jgi:DNA-binding transcriptional MerR regulator
MPVEIGGQTYHTNNEVSEDLGITRQTLWRWREKGKIPAGLRSRNRQVLFTDDEVAAIEEYANKLEPIELGSTRQQLALFGRIREAEEQ